jgi:16S rRNA processing protein RimM
MQVVVGRIGRAHGVRGEVSVEVRTDDPECRFATNTTLDTEPAAHGPLTVLRSRWHAGRLLVEFAGIGDRTTAETLRGTLLVADSATSPQSSDPDEFWDHELVDLAAVTPAGVVIGTVRQVIHLSGQDTLALERPDGEEVLVPFVAAIVVEVDVAGGRVVVDAPPGLLDHEAD